MIHTLPDLGPAPRQRFVHPFDRTVGDATDDFSRRSGIHALQPSKLTHYTRGLSRTRVMALAR